MSSRGERRGVCFLPLRLPSVPFLEPARSDMYPRRAAAGSAATPRSTFPGTAWCFWGLYLCPGWVNPALSVPALPGIIPTSMKMRVQQRDGKIQTLDIYPPFSILEGADLDRIILSDGTEHFFTKEGYYDGWGRSKESQGNKESRKKES